MNWLDSVKSDVLIQRTPQWYEFRKKHIGSSEVPIILGISEFSTPFELFLEKTGKKEAFQGNWATKRGSDAEDKIASLYTSKTGKTITSPTLEYQEWPTLSASLDGWTSDHVVVEFKYPSKAKHEAAKSGIIPEMYHAQIQSQLLVANAEIAHYVSYDGSDIVIVEIHADKNYQKRILDEAKRFWAIVESGVWEDENQILDQESGLMLDEYFKLKEQIDLLSEKQDQIKKALKEKHQRKVTIGEYVLQTIERKGNIDYSRIPELSGVDLEKYRKPPTTYFDIKKKNTNKA